MYYLFIAFLIGIDVVIYMITTSEIVEQVAVFCIGFLCGLAVTRFISDELNNDR